MRRRNAYHPGQRSLRKGLRSLQSGELFAAFGAFKDAVGQTPAADREELRAALYWLSIAALRIGRRDLAVKALRSARRFDRRGEAARLHDRYSNGYGMPRQSCGTDDDRLAFFSGQLALYLRRSGNRGFSGSGERDMVLGTIAAAWTRLSASGALAGRSCAQKAEIFGRTRIEFPWLAPLLKTERIVIAVDFFQGRKLRPTDRCSCGSGLPYSRCCGALDADRDCGAL